MPTPTDEAFDEARLLASAGRVAGSDDFGPEPFREPLSLLLDSLRAAPINDLGAMVLRGTLLRSLSQRLRAQDWFRTHPEILDEPIEAPIVMAGAPIRRRLGERHLPLGHVSQNRGDDLLARSQSGDLEGGTEGSSVSGARKVELTVMAR